VIPVIECSIIGGDHGCSRDCYGNRARLATAPGTPANMHYKTSRNSPAFICKPITLICNYMANTYTWL